MPKWVAILADSERTVALTTVRQIATALSSSQQSSITARAAGDHSLAGGAAGIALFFAYLDQVYPGAGYRAEAEHYLNRAIDRVATATLPAGLYSGFSGVAWAVSHVLSLLAPAGEDPVSDIDEVLLDSLPHWPAGSEYDLISGLVGIGVYATERLPRPAARKLLELVVARLAADARQTEAGITWWTPPERVPGWQKGQYPDGWYNLGVAHGIPGVIGLLGLACAAGVAVGQAGPLLEAAVAWLNTQRLPEPGVAAFPCYAGFGIPPRDSRLAWCYGDAGIAATLLMTGQAALKPEWEAQARALAHKAALRSPATANVVDAELCHGAAGLGHLFNRIYQATGDQAAAAAARHWFREALAMRREDAGVAGFQARTGWPEPDWDDDPGLLTGAAGIGLALLGAATDCEPGWDRLLLASRPAAAVADSATQEGRHEQDAADRLPR